MLKTFIAFVLAAAALAAGAEERPAHHGPAGYVNPYMQEAHPSIWSFFRARLFSGKWEGYDPKTYQVPAQTPDVVPVGKASDNAAVTWLGHSTVLIQHRGINVLTDPMLTRRASPASFAGPARISAPGLTLDELPPIDVVVISHDHYDHLDTGTLRKLGESTRFYVPLGLKKWFVNRGIEAERVTEMDWWEVRTLELGGEPLKITATPSQHFSGRGLFDRDRTLWAAWTIEWSDFTTWFGGDTGYNKVQFAEIGRAFPDIDLGIIPIGAYEPNWFMRTVHVNPAEAVLIHNDIGARRSMGVHWGTFLLSAEAVDEPPRALARAVQAANLSPEAFTTFAVGETRRYFREQTVAQGVGAD